MDGVSFEWHGKWHFIERCHSSGCMYMLVWRLCLNPSPLVCCFRYSLLEVNRLKWQSWTLILSALMESKEQVKDNTVVRQQPGPYPSNHLCHLIPLALCHRGASMTAMWFLSLCCGVTWSDGWCTIEWRSTSSRAGEGVCTVCVCALSSAAPALSSPWRTRPFILI